MKNLFADIAQGAYSGAELPRGEDCALSTAGGPERFDTLLTGPCGLVVERIVSHGHTTTVPGSSEIDWYDQERDEWVVVLEGSARLAYEDGREVTLSAGDTLFLPRHVRHRVSYTSAPCVWLAVHGELTEHI